MLGETKVRPQRAMSVQELWLEGHSTFRAGKAPLLHEPRASKVVHESLLAQLWQRCLGPVQQVRVVTLRVCRGGACYRRDSLGCGVRRPWVPFPASGGAWGQVVQPDWREDGDISQNHKCTYPLTQQFHLCERGICARKFIVVYLFF